MAETGEFQSLPSFLFGQSMGGAVALKVHFKQPKAWDGAILVAPMCKVFSYASLIVYDPLVDDSCINWKSCFRLQMIWFHLGR